MTSRPLFINVDESTVIFGPMLHVGWASASSIVTWHSSSRVRPRNGPPLAVRMMRRRLERSPDRRHWCTAQCSLSTGTSSAPGVARTRWTTGPAAISDSLLASASRLPAPSAASVTDRPAKPTTPLRTTAALVRLLRQEVDGRRCAERNDFVRVRIGAYDVEGLGADGTCRAENGQRAHDPTRLPPPVFAVPATAPRFRSRYDTQVCRIYCEKGLVRGQKMRILAA